MSLAMDDEEVYQTGRGPRALKDKKLNKDTGGRVPAVLVTVEQLDCKENA